MAEQRLDRIISRLRNPPLISLPTDYPRPTDANTHVESVHIAQLPGKTSISLIKLAVYDDEDSDDELLDKKQDRPSAFHLLLTAFTVLLHRYTGDNDIVIGSSSASVNEPLILRLSVNPEDPFWAVVKRVQQVEQEAEADATPYDVILRSLQAEKGDGNLGPLFRVRFFDETDSPTENYMTMTSSTSDLTIFVTRPPASTRQSIAPRISLRIIYNSLVFTGARISIIAEQLATLLNNVSSNPLAPVGSIPLLSPSQKAKLPNPVADLDWCGWKGAITDIFSRNARLYPDRTCVVQYLSQSSNSTSAQGKVVFSYNAILKASNVVSHHLIKGGIQRDDVVMIYAHRSVNLVVAVLGVLKSGATFSVIDPTYPSTRQRIYLQVAQPQGLIVLKDASRISPSVREFLSTELKIKVEIPALEVFPDGKVLGGRSDDQQDVLTAESDLCDTDPNVVLGPDSIGTLSFTSGSTGIPKGVRGRHFSLTHFFPWMASRFELNETSKFTMLSGIAHDPIQRDMFTPIFIGAELHIPTGDDIGMPGRLAEWMANCGVTVTHLTPAMGQLLSAHASRQIPTLKHAFFVGDVLAKRDCLRLQALAANVRIINMYGTTETQRAVSYFAIPPLSEDSTFLSTQKDIMPAGEGMVDVQLLVVNRNDRNVHCAVGEIGEIYVRSGGLSEGYLDWEATKTKFVNNWFSMNTPTRKDTILCPLQGSAGPELSYWKGIRDRMYRSGDLGRYLPEGTVECTGRSDDQVKIRGFRIELGEIDTHLSRHPLIRENVTLVRRNKDEEKILVTYFVPLDGPDLDQCVSEAGDSDIDEKGIKDTKRYRPLIKDVREYLSKKLPSYSIPSLFVPLTRMPLNPNGKIDKPALPYPDVAQSSPSSQNSSQNSIASAMQNIWSSLLIDVPSPIPQNESFFDLGGHSILATRLIFEIRKVFVVDATFSLVYERPTISGLVAAVERLRNANVDIISQEPNEVVAKPPVSSSMKYDQDYLTLVEKLEPTYPPPSPDFASRPITIFLTGATGFLGAFVLRDLLAQTGRVQKVICLVRAKTVELGQARIKERSTDKGVWEDDWVNTKRLEIVAGDMRIDSFGLDDATWKRVSIEADVVLHNGAFVHWVYPYETLRAANVLATLTAIRLASTGKPKAFVFMSSTSAIDTKHYLELSERLVRLSSSGARGVLENDDLEGARMDLKTGYGQSKWVSEKLLLEAGKRGLRGHIIRPGYIVGHSKTAVTNTDDFLWRLAKGSVQLGLVPDMSNPVNMVPVDHVSRCTVLAALSPLPGPGLPVLHITAKPLPTFNDIFSSLSQFGFATETCEYIVWRRKLEQHVIEKQDNALFPLLHFVLDNLPTGTRAPLLDDSNTIQLLKQDKGPESSTVDLATIGLYLSWLVGAGFLPQPSASSPQNLLPSLTQTGAIRAAGRTGM